MHIWISLVKHWRGSKHQKHPIHTHIYTIWIFILHWHYFCYIYNTTSEMLPDNKKYTNCGIHTTSRTANNVCNYTINIIVDLRQTMKNQLHKGSSVVMFLTHMYIQLQYTTCHVHHYMYEYTPYSYMYSTVSLATLRSEMSYFIYIVLHNVYEVFILLMYPYSMIIYM